MIQKLACGCYGHCTVAHRPDLWAEARRALHNNWSFVSYPSGVRITCRPSGHYEVADAWFGFTLYDSPAAALAWCAR